MAKLSTITDFVGVIFDVDDTLLDNVPGERVDALHERSRLAAVYAIGKQCGVPELQTVTKQENLDAFVTAPIHSLEAAVWNLLTTKGLANGPLQADHELLVEICKLKNELHTAILLEHGEEVPGAVQFVKTLAAQDLPLAVASTAVRQDVDAFFRKVGLTEHFPEARIITKEKVAHLKPHPEVFDTAFRSLALADADRPRVLAFEDDPRGVASAKAAGLTTCAITTCFGREQWESLDTPPDFVADSFAEFEEIFGLTRN